MRRFLSVSMLITLLVSMILLNGATGETVTVGNFSVTFNLTAPHQTNVSVTPSYMGHYPESVLQIKTFDGTAVFLETSSAPFDNEVTGTHLGYLEKDIANEGTEYGLIAFNDSTFYCVFNDFWLSSSMNIMDSMDFFRYTKISRIKK